jgi:hypothetical protein
MEAIVATGSVSGELLGEPSVELRANLADGPVRLFTPFQSMQPPLAGLGGAAPSRRRVRIGDVAPTRGEPPSLHAKVARFCLP